MNNVVCGPGAGAEGGGAGGESFYGNIPVQIRKEIMLKTLLDQRRQYIGGLCTKHCSVHKWLYTEYTQYYTPCFDGEKPPLRSVCDSHGEAPPAQCFELLLPLWQYPCIRPLQFHNSGGKNSGKFGGGLYSILLCQVVMSKNFSHF